LNSDWSDSSTSSWIVLLSLQQKQTSTHIFVHICHILTDFDNSFTGTLGGQFGAANNKTLEQKRFFSHKNDVQMTDGALKLDYASVIFVDPGVQIDKT